MASPLPRAIDNENRVMYEIPHNRKISSSLLAFANIIDRKFNYRGDNEITPATTEDYKALHRWCCENIREFWDETWNFCDLINAEKGDTVYVQRPHFKDCHFFPNAYLSFAENLLREPNDSAFCVFRAENVLEYSLTRKQAYDEVSKLHQAFLHRGVKPGDVVAAVVANTPETVITMLAANAAGAIYSSGSPDFGLGGLCDRFLQVSPKILVAHDKYLYRGKVYNNVKKILDLAKKCPSLKFVLFINYFPEDGRKPIVNLNEARRLPWEITSYSQATSVFLPKKIAFHKSNFNDPIWILYSSGTTGLPKAIVHRCGILLQMKKERLLLADYKNGDRLLQFTTCGWMMWNSMVVALCCDVALLLYDGSPFYPSAEVPWDYIVKHGCTHFGTSPKYLDQLRKSKQDIGKYDLRNLKTLTAVGSYLSHELYDYVYNNIKKDLILNSAMGGAEMVSGYFSTNVFMPIVRGEMQCTAIGMNVHCYDENGNSVVGKPGELVCLNPWPSIPLKFLGDTDDKKYLSSYYVQYPGVWTHGDIIVINPATGGVVVTGRSDAVLNKGGVRLGTAEIYRQIEKIHDVLDAVAVGVKNSDDDEDIFLFVTTRNKLLTPELVNFIKKTIRENTTARHVPDQIYQVSGIPRTITGKLAELVVKNILHNRPNKNEGVLANPECLEDFKKYAIAKFEAKL